MIRKTQKHANSPFASRLRQHAFLKNFIQKSNGLHYNAAEHKEEADTEEEKDEDEERRIMALGEKAYEGHDYVYVPFKRYPTKTMSKTQRTWNKEFEQCKGDRGNVNKRLEDFKSIGTIFGGEETRNLLA